MKRLLAVFAHPDDETFSSGGTLAFHAHHGVEVHLICATRGEAGDIPNHLAQTYDSIAQLREAELRCAASHLGLAEIHFLDFRDSGMAGTADNYHPKALAIASLDDIAAKIIHLIRMIQPQVILTHDPKGGYLHPDHIAIHQATTKAFFTSGNPTCSRDDLPAFSPKKLYYVTLPMKFLRWVVPFFPLLGMDPKRFGKNQDIDLTKLIEIDYPIHVRMNTRLVTKFKEAAIECHASQLDHGPRRRGLIKWVVNQFSMRETFMRAYPPAPQKLRENDFFDGVMG